MKLYVYDFDGTLTFKDSMFEFLKLVSKSKKGYIKKIVLHLPSFILMKCKLVPAQKVKETLLYSFLKEKNKDEIQALAQTFFAKKGNELIRPNAYNHIISQKNTNVQQVLVTASLDIWVEPFANYLGIDLISTEADFSTHNLYQKNFKSQNCNGIEKVIRLKKYLTKFPNISEVIAYGDTSGDKELLAFADRSFYRYFH